MIKISFQGELGAYSHLACQNYFSNVEVIPCKTFEEALSAVVKADAEMAMIPVENTVAGRVADIHTLLGNSNLKIYAEHFERVRHQLVARKEAEINDLKYIRSHAMGIGQCKKVIDELSLTSIIMADTAGSAKYISEEGINYDGLIKYLFNNVKEISSDNWTTLMVDLSEVATKIKIGVDPDIAFSAGLVTIMEDK